ncbi:MAG: epoxide hydrolase N-terminal domain-containing protein [Caulobacteraceae bacterium]
MSSVWSAPTRRSLLAASAFGGAMGAGLFASPAYAETAAGAGASDIRPFHVHFPDEALADLRRRVAATRWPPRETVADATQGVQLATVQALARYWTTEYDWRRCEARLNAVPNFVTEIDGLDIHFIHVRSRHENALPMIVTHGWPGSIIEQMKIIERWPTPRPMAEPRRTPSTS